MRRFAVALAAFGLVFALPVLLAEGVLRFLPVFQGIFLQPVDAAHPVARMEPNRDFTYSARPSMTRPTRKHVNNDGFISDIDYDLGAATPLLAVIGDSFVEALMVPHDETVAGRLQQASGGAARVYSFAISGAPLSQYLVWAKYARDTYNADALAIVVVSNDFDESVIPYGGRHGYHFFSGDVDRCTMALTRIDLPPSRTRWLMRSSALAQYLVFNANITSLINPAILTKLFAAFGKPATADSGQPPLNAAAGTSRDHREVASLCAIDSFFQMLPGMTGLPPERILFLVDGLREYNSPDPDAGLAGTYFGRMRSRFMDTARARGYGVADLHPTFRDRHRQDGTRFNFSDDGHWNGDGHQVAAEAIAAWPAWRSLTVSGRKPE